MAEKKKGMMGKLWDEVKASVSPNDPQGQAKPAPPPPKPKPKGDLDKGSETLGPDARRKQLEELKGYKKGGMVKKTGPAKLHKGERVLTVAQTKAFNKSGSKQTVKPSAGKASKKR